MTDMDSQTANASLDVRIIDDVPTAVLDTDSIAAGSYAPATGNVITDNDAAGADSDVDNAVGELAVTQINATTDPAADVAGTWQYNADNELVAYNGYSFDYDANGNMTRRSGSRDRPSSN